MTLRNLIKELIKYIDLDDQVDIRIIRRDNDTDGVVVAERTVPIAMIRSFERPGIIIELEDFEQAKELQL